MSLFDEGPSSSLEDVLGQQANTATMNIQNQFAKKRRQSVAQQAHAGRLGSGVANYQAGDIAGEELGALGGVQSDLASALGQIPTNDYLSEQDFQRNLQLAKYIASLDSPSSLQEALGALGAVGGIAGTAAAFF